MPAEVQEFQEIFAKLRFLREKGCRIAGIGCQQPGGAVKACRNAGISLRAAAGTSSPAPPHLHTQKYAQQVQKENHSNTSR
jgi:hypothetical protein